jgi:hypothetical protein
MVKSERRTDEAPAPSRLYVVVNWFEELNARVRRQ